ncbi:ATP-dependent DNA helicase [Legionella septentrionalis]|uniref:ATP-dependent DNA helicase n=1 Tax=Legionella septentrionalis TaxID=2498109 RepID=UPI000F8C32A9|nr:ATP-dependent DNA helicase [Legionella septentrionalis]RUQ94337.1 ATP-dependent DNA helicase [Legionella septentrionalis]
MGITPILEDFVTNCRRVLSEQGRLFTAIPGFVARTQQIDLAIAIAKAIEARATLVAEAGTGIGKTFAYLVPCLLSGKKALISTATKTLQDQLFQKDLPVLVRALGLSVRVQNLKGRANYICRYRLDLHVNEGQFSAQQIAHEVLYIHEKLPRLIAGERNELPEIQEESAVWPFVTSTSENCLGVECSYHAECFLVKARKRALDADVVILNHHLYFADSRLKTEGFGELLPGVDVVVFDEAHQLAEIASNFYGERISTRQLHDLLDDMLRVWSVLEEPYQFLQQSSQTLGTIIHDLLEAYPSFRERSSWTDLKRYPSFLKSWEALLLFMQEWSDYISGMAVQEHPGLQRCKERLDELCRLLTLFQGQKLEQIRWVERFKHSLVFHTTPFMVADSFQTLLRQQTCTYVFTSATLTMASSFDCFTKPLGLTDVQTQLLPSSFDFKTQALLYLPRALPDPKDDHYHEALLAKALPVINACGGRCFFLFTSHRALQRMADLLSTHLNFPLLIQGEEAKPILLARFRELGNAVLLGTATFWEGVDVKGEALSCVIIDKIPFASPTDPVMRGKMDYLKARGLSGFDELSLPNAILALKQGVGRLIRDAADRGILMIADPRLTARDYSRQIFASLPPMRKTREEHKVLSFINQLGLKILDNDTELL